MRRLVCAGCGVGEDLDNPKGLIHPMQFVDTSSTFEMPGGSDKTASEDLFIDCRNKIRREFFGIPDGELKEMPMMKAV